MRYLLDSNVFIALAVRDDRKIGRRLRMHVHEAALSSIVLHELYFGAFGSQRLEHSLGVVERITAHCTSC